MSAPVPWIGDLGLGDWGLGLDNLSKSFGFDNRSPMRENVGCSFHSSHASWDLRLEEGLGLPRGLRVLRERSEKPCPVGACVCACVDSLNVIEDFSLDLTTYNDQVRIGHYLSHSRSMALFELSNVEILCIPGRHSAHVCL